MTLEELLKPQSSSPWDKFVPIIHEKNVTKVYLTEDIAEASLYNELCYSLLSASRADEFQLYINTPGGYVDTALMIIDAIKRSKAKVVAYISGAVCSAGTIITLACDEVIVADHTTFMIHNYSAGMVGKGHEMKARQEFMDRNLNASFRTFYRGFLTDKEMKEVIDGKDMWMDKVEVEARLLQKERYLRTDTLIETIGDLEEKPDAPVSGCTPKRRGRPRKDS